MHPRSHIIPRLTYGRSNFLLKFILASGVLILLGSIIVIQYQLFREYNIVDGWKANADCYAADFIFPNEYTNLTTVNNPCYREKVPTILIVIASAVGNLEQRRTIRETWATGSKEQNEHVGVLFLVGRSKYTKFNNKVIDENMKYGDVIVENFLDTYYNLTVKSIMILKWVNQNCRNVAFIMKMDDDVYLNIDNLMKLTEEFTSPKNFLMGKLYAGLQPDRRVTSKWYVPEHIYSSSTYPDFLCGVGFLMSRDVAKRLYEESFKLKLFFLEDMFLTGMCAENAGIKRKNHIGFHFFEHAVKIECNAIHTQMILLSHYLDAYDMREMHKELTKCYN